MNFKCITSHAKQVSFEEILAIKNEIGEIPPLLVEFYCNSNGGIPPKKRLLGPNEERIQIQSLLSIIHKRNEHDYTANEMHAIITNNWGSPKSYFPIARDPGGNYLCLNRDTGNIILVYNDDDDEIIVSNDLESFFRKILK